LLDDLLERFRERGLLKERGKQRTDSTHIKAAARNLNRMVCLVSLIFVQFLLLTVALEGYLGGHIEVTLPTALVSGLCCAAAYWLLRYILVPSRR
jgi:hypothetical protein